MTATEYQKYLRSIHWVQFRKFVLRQRGGACEECGISNVWACMSYGQPLNVHHLSYSRLGQEQPQDVRVLCRRCHETAHGAATLPDMGNLFWKFCRAFKEAPETAWKWAQTIDSLPMCETSQLRLAFADS